MATGTTNVGFEENYVTYAKYKAVEIHDIAEGSTPSTISLLILRSYELIS